MFAPIDKSLGDLLAKARAHPQRINLNELAKHHIGKCATRPINQRRARARAIIVCECVSSILDELAFART